MQNAFCLLYVSGRMVSENEESFVSKHVIISWFIYPHH